jgi:hypothetical protein
MFPCRDTIVGLIWGEIQWPKSLQRKPVRRLRLRRRPRRPNQRVSSQRPMFAVARSRQWRLVGRYGSLSLGVTEQSDVYSDFIEAELKAERDRKTALDTRAASLVTTSGSLVTILAAVGAFVGREAGSSFPRHALPLLVLALTAFAFASLAGICSGWTRPHAGAADTASMQIMLRDRWVDDEVLARKEVVDVHIRMIEGIRSLNKAKERFLRAGWVCQIIALVLLSVVVLIVLATR